MIIYSGNNQGLRHDQDNDGSREHRNGAIDASSITSAVHGNGNGSIDIPGSDFDPQSRSFKPQELRPRPLTKRAKKKVYHSCNFILNFIINKYSIFKAVGFG